MADAAALHRGLLDPMRESQIVFRLLLRAMSEPGSVIDLSSIDLHPPGGMPDACAAILLALADHETGLWLADRYAGPGSARWLEFHSVAPVVSDKRKAAFALLDNGAPVIPFDQFNLGDDRYPEQSTTLLVPCSSMSDGLEVHIRGPGINGERAITPTGLPAGFWQEACANAERFPCGVDIILSSGRSVLCLPRSTQIAIYSGVF